MASLPKIDEDFSIFWQKHETTMPMLALQAKKYLVICATSVLSESAFQYLTMCYARIDYL